MTSIHTTENRKGVILLSGISFYIRYVIIAFILVFFILFICRICNIPLSNVANSPKFKENIKEHVFFGVALISIFGPFVEEILFRLWLSFKRLHLFFSILVFAYYILTQLFSRKDSELIYGLVSNDLFYLAHVKLICASCIASCVFLIKKSHIEYTKKKYGDIISLMSVLVFALIHISNFSGSWFYYFIAIFMCLPQLVLGIVATYYRLRLGFIYGLVFHGFINLFGFCMSYGSEIVHQLSHII